MGGNFLQFLNRNFTYFDTNLNSNRTLQLAKSSHRINALMNDNGPGFLSRKRKPINRRQDSTIGEGGLEQDEDKLIFYISPQIQMYRLESIIEASIARKMSEDEDNRLYDPVRAKLMCQALSKDIRTKVKELDLRRYRIVCVVSIVEKRLQSIDYKMLFCVDSVIDYYGNVKFETAQYYIFTTVYLVYKD